MTRKDVLRKKQASEGKYPRHDPYISNYVFSLCKVVIYYKVHIASFVLGLYGMPLTNLKTSLMQYRIQYYN